MGGVVTCPEKYAAEAGRELFKRGGNTADAAIATAIAQAVTNPLLVGIGGTSRLFCYDRKSREPLTLNAEVAIGSVPVPREWAKEFVGRAETVGRYISQGDE